jgi:hypothetical protein
MRHLTEKWLTTHAKKKKKTPREPFRRDLAHDGVDTLNCPAQAQPSRMNS